MFRLKPTTQARRLKGFEKQPLRAAGSSRRAAAYELKGTVQKRKKSAFPPRGISTCFGICLSLGPNLEEAKVRGQCRSSRWHRFSIVLRDGEGGFKAQINGSLRVSSKCATFLTTQENVKWHKTAERREEERQIGVVARAKGRRAELLNKLSLCAGAARVSCTALLAFPFSESESQLKWIFFFNEK